VIFKTFMPLYKDIVIMVNNDDDNIKLYTTEAAVWSNILGHICSVIHYRNQSYIGVSPYRSVIDW